MTLLWGGKGGGAVSGISLNCKYQLLDINLVKAIRTVSNWYLQFKLIPLTAPPPLPPHR